MPYLRNGNVKDYLIEHLNKDRLQIVRWSKALSLPRPVMMQYFQLHEISLGLDHLHSHQIVHGDLKAVSGLKCRVMCTPNSGITFLLAECPN
jgi:serine/threonine protein kinase